MGGTELGVEEKVGEADEAQMIKGVLSHGKESEFCMQWGV